MPDAMCLPDLLVLLFSLVADFAVSREEAMRPENELAEQFKFRVSAGNAIEQPCMFRFQCRTGH